MIGGCSGAAAAGANLARLGAEMSHPPGRAPAMGAGRPLFERRAPIARPGGADGGAGWSGRGSIPLLLFSPARFSMSTLSFLEFCPDLGFVAFIPASHGRRRFGPTLKTDSILSVCPRIFCRLWPSDSVGRNQDRALHLFFWGLSKFVFAALHNLHSRWRNSSLPFPNGRFSADLGHHRCPPPQHRHKLTTPVSQNAAHYAAVRNMHP